MNYKYERDHFIFPPDTDFYGRSRTFKNRLEDGWRMVSIVKENKDTYWVYWEKPDE